MPRRPREEDEDEHYDASSVGSGRSQRSRVDGGAAADAPSEEAILAALEQETSSAQEEADILKEGADVKRFLLKQNNDVKQGTCAPSPFSPPMLVVLNQSSFLIAYLSLHQKRKKSFYILLAYFAGFDDQGLAVCRSSLITTSVHSPHQPVSLVANDKRTEDSVVSLHYSYLHFAFPSLPFLFLSEKGLLQQPAACLGVFRYLTALSKHYILRLLFIEGPFPMSKIHAWRSYTAISEHSEALAEVAGKFSFFFFSFPLMTLDHMKCAIKALLAASLQPPLHQRDTGAKYTRVIVCVLTPLLPSPPLPPPLTFRLLLLSIDDARYANLRTFFPVRNASNQRHAVGLGLWTIRSNDGGGSGGGGGGGGAAAAAAASAEGDVVELSPPFKVGLRLALNGGGAPWREALKEEKAKNIPSEAEFNVNVRLVHACLPACLPAYLSPARLSPACLSESPCLLYLSSHPITLTLYSHARSPCSY